MRTLKVIVEYDGTDFHGWQKQTDPALRTVQQTVEAALSTVLNEPIVIHGSSRTDRGVHAQAHPASFTTTSRLPVERILLGANSKMPPDVALRSVEEVAEGFHARYQARAKHYRYSIWNAEVRSPLRLRYMAHEPRPLVVAYMKEAAALLVGTHDFYSFATAGDERESTVRTLFRVDVTRRSGEPDVIDIDVEGDGFLYNMVRTLAGTLVEIGLGQRLPSSIPQLLARRNRSAGGVNMPPQGLTLIAVRYEI